MKAVSLVVPICTVLVFVFITVRTRFTHGVNWFMASASGFLASGIVTAGILFVMQWQRYSARTGISGAIKSFAMAVMVIFAGIVLHQIFKKLGELKSAVDTKLKFDDLSKVAIKILNGDENYFQMIVAPNKSGKWRDYARHTQTFPRVRRSRPTKSS